MLVSGVLFRVQRDSRKLKARLVELTSENGALVRELSHRVKNNLQTVSSLMKIKAREFYDEYGTQSDVTTGMHKTLVTVQKRIDAISLVHQHILDDPRVYLVCIRSFMTELIEELRSRNGYEPQIPLHAEELTIDLDHAVPLGIIACDLISKAIEQDKAANAASAFNQMSASLKRSETNVISFSLANIESSLVREITERGVDRSADAVFTQGLASQIGACWFTKKLAPNRFEMGFHFPQAPRRSYAL